LREGTPLHINSHTVKALLFAGRRHTSSLSRRGGQGQHTRAQGDNGSRQTKQQQRNSNRKEHQPQRDTRSLSQLDQLDRKKRGHRLAKRSRIAAFSFSMNQQSSSTKQGPKELNFLRFELASWA
jgi:hypothetical protein